MNNSKIAKILLDKGILSFSFEPPYVFTNGIKSPIYIDNRMLISYPKEREFIVNALVDLIRSEIKDEIDYVASSLSSASPFGVLVAEKLDLPIILIREEEKLHGKKNRIEGFLPKGKKVLIVEDHVSTGKSLIENVDLLKNEGAIVKYAVAITDYEFKKSKEAIKNKGINLLVLAKGIDLLNSALEQKVLEGKEKEEVLEWFNDPIEWGTVRGYYGNSN